MQRLFALIILCAIGRTLAAAELPPPPGVDAFVGCKKYPADKKFKWTVRGEVGVAELAASLGEISCRPILVGSAVAQRGGKVVLEVPDLVTASDVYRLFYGALEAMGYTVDTSGGAIKIVDSGRAKEVAAPQLEGAVASDDRFIVRLMRPKHAAASELADVLGKMKSKEGDVSVFGAASLVIIDRAGNVRRMEEVARALDVGESGARVFTLTTHGQTPTDLAASIEKILGAAAHRPAAGAPDKSGKPTGAAIDADVRALVPLDQAHLVAVIGSDAGFARVRAVAERLDPPADDGAAAQGHVIYLANTNAEDMAATLGTVGLAGRGTGSARPSGASGSSAPSAAVTSAAGALPLTGDVRIGADKTANALVVFANASDFATVRDLVQKLDIPRRQVYVEAVILDLSIDKLREIGVSWHQIGNAAGNAAFASSASTSIASIDTKKIATLAAGAGLTAGIMGSSFNILGQDVPGLGVVLHALEQSKDANVISRPHLLTMDNVKASLSVGQRAYYPSQSLTSAVATGGAITSNYAPQDIALKLELTPHLNDSPSIRLEINGEISDIPEGASNTGGGPTTNRRTVQTAVVVCDGQSVVLGGLTKETDSVAVDKVPFLGDIPLLGRLFQTRSKKRVKQDLLIVLTPYIVRGPEDLRRIQERKDAEHREFLERSTAFSDNNFEAHVDYRRKRGVLEEVNLTALAAARDAEAFRAAERQLKPMRGDGPIALEPAMESSNRAAPEPSN